MKLEELRDNDLGNFSVWIPKLGDGPQSLTHLTFHRLATTAFYITCQQIEQLETGDKIIHQGDTIQTGVGTWFIAIESYINSLLRIACLLTDKSFGTYKTKELGSRIGALIDLLGIDRGPFYTGPFQRLEEFKCYRNELFHDRTNDSALIFRKTAFGGNPMYANQVDIMQAAVIALEVFEAFRYVYVGLALMPQIPVKKDDSTFFAHLDHLYNRVLRPYFERSLSKHGLTSAVETRIRATPLSTSSIAKNGDVSVCVKHALEEKFNFHPSQEKTNIGRQLLDAVRNEINFDTANYFMLPTYNR